MATKKSTTKKKVVRTTSKKKATSAKIELPPRPDRVSSRWRRIMELCLIAAVALSGLYLLYTIHQQRVVTPVALSSSSRVSPDVRLSLIATAQAIDALATDQQHNEVSAVDIVLLRNLYAESKADAMSGNSVSARKALADINDRIIRGRHAIDAAVAARKAKASIAANISTAALGMSIPILLYHEPPANFGQQLDHLKAAGYTTVTMDQAYASLHDGVRLAAKPVVITFDDGLASQMQAYEQLKTRNMKATFYIITAGTESRWCIGAGRRYNDPLQPPSGCGDAYLNWDQVRMLDKSGLIEIEAHTVNHRNLASLDTAAQQFEIAEGKRTLEAQIGHPVYHLAYPYGQYNGTTVQVTAAAGFRTAVTTQPGTIQSIRTLFTMPRVRDALLLP